MHGQSSDSVPERNADGNQGQIWLVWIIIILACIALASVLVFGLLRGRFQPTAAERLAATITTLNVDMNDNYYGETDTNLVSPPVWTVTRGADVLVNMTNMGQLNHNWAIVKLGETIPIPFRGGQSSGQLVYGAGMVYGNNVTTLTFTAPESGEYQIICTVEGHYPSMQGRLVIE